MSKKTLESFCMKKSLLKILCSAVIAVSLASCASIPEPSEKKDNLLYGQVEFNFSCIPNNYGIPEASTEKGGIEVKFRNIKTNKTITMTTNYKGEFAKAGIPAGTYIIHSLKKKIKYASAYEAEYSATFDKNKTTNFHFKPVSNAVVNMGKISLDISITDIGYYRWSVNWGKGYDETYNNFASHYLESAWLDKEWLTPQETLPKRY